MASFHRPSFSFEIDDFPFFETTPPCALRRSFAFVYTLRYLINDRPYKRPWYYRTIKFHCGGLQSRSFSFSLALAVYSSRPARSAPLSIVRPKTNIIAAEANSYEDGFNSKFLFIQRPLIAKGSIIRMSRLIWIIDYSMFRYPQRPPCSWIKVKPDSRIDKDDPMKWKRDEN